MNKPLILALTTFTAGCIEGAHVDSGNPTLTVKRVGYIAEHDLPDRKHRLRACLSEHRAY